MFTVDELTQIFNILIQRPYSEVAGLIVRLDQEYSAIQAAQAAQAAAEQPAVDVNAGSVGA